MALGTAKGQPPHPRERPAHPSSNPRMPHAPACPRKRAARHRLAYPEPAPGVEARLPGEAAGVEEEPAAGGSQGIRPFRDGEVGAGLRAARVLPKWWGAQDSTARRAEAGEPAGDVGEAGPWGEAQRLGIRGPRADPDGGGCGRLEGGAGSGQRHRQERPRPVPRRVLSPPLPSPRQRR